MVLGYLTLIYNTTASAVTFIGDLHEWSNSIEQYHSILLR